jgi:hypothetical protein
MAGPSLSMCSMETRLPLPSIFEKPFSNLLPACMLSTPAEGPTLLARISDLCNRVLYDAQQTYFEWAKQTALCKDLAAFPTAPTFSALISAVRTNRHHVLSPSPLSWYTIVDNPAPGVACLRIAPQTPALVTLLRLVSRVALSQSSMLMLTETCSPASENLVTLLSRP